jgi:hypothetical protein
VVLFYQVTLGFLGGGTIIISFSIEFSLVGISPKHTSWMTLLISAVCYLKGALSTSRIESLSFTKF